MDVAYTGEQWRLGTNARTDQISFEYSLNASDLSTGTWTGVCTGGGSSGVASPGAGLAAAGAGTTASTTSQTGSEAAGVSTSRVATVASRASASR